MSELPFASVSKRGQVQNRSYENEFYLQVNENSFSHEMVRTWPRFEIEAKGNSKIDLLYDM